MVLNIHTVGGFDESGKNMTVVDMGDDAVMIDSGFYMPAIVEMQEQERVGNQPKGRQQAYSEKQLRNRGAIADDTTLDKLGLRHKVRAILLGHAHLDHIGALPYMAHRYDAPIAGTPFTIEVLRRILEDEQIVIPNKLHSIKPNATFIIKGKKRDYKAEFINITHSTIQTTMIALHTPDGIVLYANDFKLDDNPILGQPPNYYALRKIAKEGIKCLIVDSLYSSAERKTPSEKIARAMLEEVLLTIQNRHAAIFVPTFSSHIARLKSVVDFAKKLNRQPFFIGRSLNKYVTAAANVGMCPFRNDIRIGSYKRQVESMLKQVAKNRENTMVICTGHQGEPGSILERISRKQLPFSFKPNDNIVFSSKTIPVAANIENKSKMDKRLKKSGVRIFDEVHVSGHPGREDLRDLLGILNPENIIPSHGSTEQLLPMIELASEMGYKKGKESHLMHDKGKLALKK
jgi:ribonuclease J